MRQSRRPAVTQPQNSRLWRAAAALLPIGQSSGLLQRDQAAATVNWLPTVLAAALIVLILALIVLAIRDFRSYRQRAAHGTPSGVLRDPRTRFRRPAAVDEDEPAEDEPSVDEARPNPVPEAARAAAETTAALFARAIAGAARLTTLAGETLRRRREAAFEADEHEEPAPQPAAHVRRRRPAAAPPIAPEPEPELDGDDEPAVDWEDLPEHERRRWQQAVEQEVPPVRERSGGRIPSAEQTRWDQELGDGAAADNRRGAQQALPNGEQLRWQQAVDTGKTLGQPQRPAAADDDDGDDALLSDLLSSDPLRERER